MLNKIFHLGFGYSMTLNSFYKVISETNKTVTVRRIKSKIVEGDGFQGRETYVDEFAENKTFKCLKTANGIKGSLDHSRTQYLDEVKENETFYFNHLD